MTVATTSTSVQSRPVSSTDDTDIGIRQFRSASREATWSDKPTARVITLTPTLAKYLLSTMPFNRPTRLPFLRQIGKAINAGQFALNGEPIIIGADGRMMDGFHRSTAVTQTGIPIEVMMVFGVDPALMPTLDGGTVRNLTDHMCLGGTAYGPETQAMGALAKVMMLYDKGARESIFTTGRRGAGPAAELRDVTTDEIAAYCKAHEGEMLAAVKAARPVAARFKIRPVALGMAIILCARENEDLTFQMVEDLRERAALPGTSERALLNRYERHAQKQQVLTPFYQMRCFIRCFNAWQVGEYLAVIPTASREGDLGWLDPVCVWGV